MPDEVTTTRKGFPVVDITHKPRRTQAGNLAAAGKLSVPSAEEEESSPRSSFHSLESAVAYYEERSKSGADASLNLATSKWLKELIQLRAAPKRAAEGE